MRSGWSIKITRDAEREILALPADMRARFAAICDLMLADGPAGVGMPLVRPIERKLWEMRMKGRDGIARAIYFTASGKRVVVVHAFVKKTEKTPTRAIELARRRMREFDD